MLLGSLARSQNEDMSNSQDERLANPQPSASIDREGKKASRRKRGCLITINACNRFCNIGNAKIPQAKV
ncbi:hypothetical protein BPOR_1523g00020 [Botrytis porri]|uniref:Uncharacterized protein n=1 Tax=Botrytis porri TaxID=87229 RepID=A0A4Z1KBM1_9HELO|nr:hypothetical protein BPOR_1523g00020 [Botrytis porri]